MALDYRQVISQAVGGWWKSCEPGTSCEISINGTTKSGANARVYLTDLIITSTAGPPVHLYVIDGTTGGTRYLLRNEISPGTSCIFDQHFNVYPRTTWGTGLYVYAESVANGTVCLAAGGFNL